MNLIDEILKKFSPAEIFQFLHRNNVENISEEEIKILQEHIIKIDQRGKWCVLLAEKFNEKVDLKALEDTVIRKDKSGQFCYAFAKFVKGSDKEKLKKAIQEKDKIGYWKTKFDEDIK